MKNLWIWFVIAVIAVGGYIALSKKPGTTDTETVKIGAALGLTGDTGEWGADELSAITAAVAEHNAKGGKQIALVVEDTKSTGTGTVNAVMKLVTVDKVDAIFGPTWGDSFQGGFPIVEKAKIPTVTPSSALEAVEGKFDYVFSTWWPQPQEIATLIAHMEQQGYKTVALVRDNDAFNTKFMDLFGAALPKSIRIVDKPSFPIGTTDFRTTILKLREEKPDAVMLSIQDTSQIGPFMKQAKELGLASKIMSTTSAESPENIKKFPGYFEGLAYSYPDTKNDPRLRELQKASKDNNGPSFVNAYNAASILIKAIEESEGGDIEAALLRVSAPGIGVKEVSFNEKHQIADAAFKIKIVKNNSFEDFK